MSKVTIKWPFILLFVVAAILNTTGLQHVSADTQAQSQAQVTVIGNDSTPPTVLAERTVPLTDNDTAFDALVSTVGIEHVTYTDNSTLGKYITIINGIGGQDSNNYWALYTNGISSPVGSDGYSVQNGDHLTFKYVNYPDTLKNAVSLKVIGKDQKVVYSSPYEISILSGANAFALLQVTLGQGKVGYDESQYGKLINKIDGITPAGSDYWEFLINGKPSNGSADHYELMPGDSIVFQYKTVDNSPATDGSTTTVTGNGSSSVTEPMKISPISGSVLQAAIDRVAQYTLDNELSEWDVIALKQAGKYIPSTYLDQAEKLVVEKQGHGGRITDMERHALGILAAGGNPTNINGYNLIQSIYTGEVNKQGLNGVAYALIVLNSGDFTVPDSTQWNKDKLLNALLSAQNNDGGWMWDGSKTSDVDTTAMVLAALAPYQDQPSTKAKIESAVTYLASQYTAGKINNSSSAAQAIIALSALGIDANGPRFTKGEGSLFKLLLSYQNTDGGFDWQGGDVSDAFSTSQPFEALVAYQLMKQGKGSIYDLRMFATTTKQTGVATNSNQHSLPNTGTSSWNWLLSGIGLLILGIVLYGTTIGRKKTE